MIVKAWLNLFKMASPSLTSPSIMSIMVFINTHNIIKLSNKFERTIDFINLLNAKIRPSRPPSQIS